MIRLAMRGFKSILNVRLNLPLVLVVIILTVCITSQFMESMNLCPTIRSERFAYKSKNIDPKVLAEIKRQWILDEGCVHGENVQNSKLGSNEQTQSSPYQHIDCSINNNDEIIDCLRHKDHEDDIYMPWNFIKRYFEVYGKVAHYDGYERFEFSHSYSEVYYDPKKEYHFDGVFLTFDSYNVEVRDRVKLVTGVEGVPLSTQWGPKGYFYPIQIAQFAMSHYCKNITEKPPVKSIYETGKMAEAISLSLGNGATLTLGNTVENELSLDIKFITNGSLTIVVDGSDKKRYSIHYLTHAKRLIDFDGDRAIRYHIGSSSSWRHFSRDIRVDLRKGIGMTKSKAVKKVRISIKKIVSLTFRGEGLIDNVCIQTADHMTHFLAGTNWILENQNKETGGWPIMVERRLEGFPSLPPGWHSAMAQGHGLSTMVRAYKYTRDARFLPSLRLALRPYTVPSSKGGVRAIFMDRFVWYEEYPTTPSSFVLNGFIFSLLGLYDYKMLLSSEKEAGNPLGQDDEAALSQATDLYNDGMSSLKVMLPLYDAGFTTIYDLRHYQLKTQPNLARWDYHATHISQLALLSTIDDDPIFKQFHDNWMGYTKGIRAKHN